MLDKIANLLMEKPIVVPRILLYNYHKLDLTSDELVFVIYLLQCEDIFNPKTINRDLNLELSNIMTIIDNLTNKGILSLEVKKDTVRTEIVNLQPLYKKLAFLVTTPTEQTNTSLYGYFEEEFGRSLSSMEYEIINAWLDNNFTEELIRCALKESIYNGVTNLRYIDKILHEWKKKGYKCKNDVEKGRKNFKESKPVKKDDFDYDWLSGENG